MSEAADYADLGRMLADTIDKLSMQRPFAGDMEGTFIVPLSGGDEYEVVVRRKETSGE